MRQKIKDHYKTEFSSSNNGMLEITDEEIDFIIKHDCKCYGCSKSIFEMDDFPELLTEADELICEQCYDEDYTMTCPICEDSYDIYDGESEYEVIVEGDEDYNFEYAGIYKNGRLIVPIKINEFKKIEIGENCCEVYSDKICNDCVEKYIRKENFLLLDYGIPCLLVKRCSHEIFSDWSIEKIKRHRKTLIHKRITCRGIIEQANEKALPFAPDDDKKEF